jgi:hypothetical protein
VNEDLFAYCTVSHYHDPILSATILTHDTVDKAHMSVASWIDYTVILTSSHSSENLVKVVRHRLIVGLKHLFSFLSCVGCIIPYALSCCQA